MHETSDKELFKKLFPQIREFQALAVKYGIDDVFQDNGGKLLQVLLLLDLKNLEGRQGNDAVDIDGNEFELKSANIGTTTKSFSTHHHLNPTVLDKYRKVTWFFAIYEGIELKMVYKMTPDRLEPYFKKWEKKWKKSRGKDINNPKIPIKYVIDNGQLYYKN